MEEVVEVLKVVSDYRQGSNCRLRRIGSPYLEEDYCRKKGNSPHQLKDGARPVGVIRKDGY